MYAKVIVDISNDAVDKVFDYVALEDTQVGMRVSVPFANRTVLGYVIDLCEETSFDKTKVKSIISNKESVPKLKPEILALAKFFLLYPFNLNSCVL